MKKLLATDLDGTLLRDDKTISDFTKTKIHEMINEENYFVIATGRPYHRIVPILDDLDIRNEKNYCICFNGGLITRADGKEIIYEEKLLHDQVEELISLAEKFNLGIMVYVKDKILVDYIPEHLMYLTRLHCLNIIDGGKDYLKTIEDVYKVIIIGSKEELTFVKDNTPSELKEKYNFTRSSDAYLEITPKNVNKGNAIKILSKKLNVDLANAYAIGDEENDLSMIKATPNGCAVANAKEICKEASSIITSSNMEDGVGHLIEQYILKPKILISACLVGDNCKYNGGNNLNNELLNDLKDYTLIKICPEVFGGLPTPRVPSEVKGDKVLNQEGIDVTSNYQNGAKISLEIAKKHNIKIAILKAKSPSCGKDYIYDGTFSHTLTSSDGVTVKLFKENGIKVYSELDYKEMFK